MSDKKYNLHVGDVIESDETWRVKTPVLATSCAPPFIFQRYKNCQSPYWADSQSFSEKFGYNARLIVTDIYHEEGRYEGHNDRSPSNDQLTLQLLDENGEYNSLAQVFDAVVNLEFLTIPQLSNIKVVDHYQRTFIPVCDPK